MGEKEMGLHNTSEPAVAERERQKKRRWQTAEQ